MVVDALPMPKQNMSIDISKIRKDSGKKYSNKA